MSSVVLPGGGKVRSELGSVEDREWEGVPPPSNADLRRLSGVRVTCRAAGAEKAPDVGLDSSVRSVILLRRMRGSAWGRTGERDVNVGSEVNEGEPV
jgi:hypothetical protein